MYECGFGDCFRLETGQNQETGQNDLYVDFGIHTASWTRKERERRFDYIISEMKEKKDFLLSHYHEDHFNGAMYMAKNSSERFTNVYIPDVWDMTGKTAYVVSLILLRGIFTRSIISGENTIIDFLEMICNKHARVHFISRGVKFQNDQYIALWPEKDYVNRRAQRIFYEIQNRVGQINLIGIERIANSLNEIVINMSETGNDNHSGRFNELREQYARVQRDFDEVYGGNYDKNIQYKLTKFGNEISIVFQNYQADRNVLFTGDFGKKENWSFIERNVDGKVDMHSYYEVIKVPHHGTESYYHDFTAKMDEHSTLIIPNGYINRGKSWYVCEGYKRDSLKKYNRTVCAGHSTCLKPICPKGNYIYRECVYEGGCILGGKCGEKYEFCNKCKYLKCKTLGKQPIRHIDI